MSALRREERVGQAWQFIRNRQYERALEAFNDVIRSMPDNVDAHYGLGIVQRALGDHKASIASYQKTLELAQNALKAVRTTSSVDGNTAANDLETQEDDRFLMLITMIKQRLAELGVQA